MRSEPEAEQFVDVIDREEDCRISAGTYLELGIVVDSGNDPLGATKLDLLLGAQDIKIEPTTGVQARIARAAYQKYGKGSGHPAGLNFGDCFAYALASELGHSLLYKGNDFARTDLTPAIES